MRLLTRILFILITGLLTLQAYASTRGISVNIRDQSGKQVGMYEKSHALLIGVSDYTAGWPDLGTIPSELKHVESILKNQGFNTVTVINPDSKRMKQSFEDFINEYGYNENDRLLFFFSGHGYSQKNGTKGYLVPTDAPNPEKDRKGFLRKALNMSQIITWSRQMETKHALFLFDSCFSGAIFKTKALPKTPPHITAFTARPVRQYITAGSAGEEVPAKSVFTPSIVRALEGEADLNRDGYVTGTEMGMFLNEKVMGYNNQQTPQYGKIKDPDLDRGDFVFVIGQQTQPQTTQTPSSIDAEDAFWKAIENSTNIQDFQDYLTDYPSGKFSRIARIKIRQLKREQKKARLADESQKTGESGDGKIKISSQPSNALIYINNAYQGTSPLILKLKPGLHTIKALKDGYRSEMKTIQVQSKKQIQLSYILHKLAGSIRITSSPNSAAVYLDKQYRGTTPLTINDLAKGSYSVVLKKEGYKDWWRSVYVTTGKELRLSPILKKFSSGSLARTDQDSSFYRAGKLHSQGKDKEALKTVAGFLSHKDPTVRLKAVKLIGKIGGNEAGKLLIPTLSDSDNKVKKAAIKSMGQIRYAPAAKRLVSMSVKAEGDTFEEIAAAIRKIGPPAIDLLVKAYNRTRDADVIRKYKRVMLEVGPSVITGIAKNLAGKTYKQNRKNFELLIAFRSPRVASWLLQEISNEEVADMVVESLVKLGNLSIKPVMNMLKAYKDRPGDRNVKVRLIKILGELRSIKSTSLLEDMTMEDDDTVRMAAESALRRIRGF